MILLTGGICIHEQKKKRRDYGTLLSHRRFQCSHFEKHGQKRRFLSMHFTYPLRKPGTLPHPAPSAADRGRAEQRKLMLDQRSGLAPQPQRTFIILLLSFQQSAPEKPKINRGLFFFLTAKKYNVSGFQNCIKAHAESESSKSAPVFNTARRDRPMCHYPVWPAWSLGHAHGGIAPAGLHYTLLSPKSANGILCSQANLQSFNAMLSVFSAFAAYIEKRR